MARGEAYDVAILGAGPGGYAAAFLAADLGMRVALVDEEANPGGVCLYRGCIPSKALLHIASLLHETEVAKAAGVEFARPRISIDALRAWKDGVVERHTAGLGQLAKQRGVDFVRGRGTFADAHALDVTPPDGKTRRVAFDHAIIATGSHPAPIPKHQIDSPHLLDSTSALALKEIPETMLVIGGGYIGLELGTVYASLGARVTVVEMMSGILPGVDRDLVRVLEKRVSSLFEAVLTDTTVAGMSAQKHGVSVSLEGKGAEGAELFGKVLVSVGRRPNSTGLGLENTKVQVDRRGFIQVDAQRRTAEPSLWAIGDVVGEPMLAHKASHEGRVAVEAIAGEKVAFEPAAIPAVVFTDPEIAWCGLTETQAKKAGREVTIAKFPWAASGRATTLLRNDGLTKLVVDPRTERVLGVGIAGVGAGEMIAEGVLAIEMGSVASDLALTIHAHPTLSETIKGAAEVFYGTATDLYRPRRKG